MAGKLVAIAGVESSELQDYARSPTARAKAAGSGADLQRARPLPEREVISHNLAGQRLGRKGQETRERIITAAVRLLDDPESPPVNLTSVAREAEVRLTNLYLYFPDFNCLLLATLRRVMADADGGFLARREYWSDQTLTSSCAAFLLKHFHFWQRHARMLHMRNNLAEIDPRMLAYRLEASRPILDFIAQQMDRTGRDRESRSMANVLWTSIERLAAVTTIPHFQQLVDSAPGEAEGAELADLLAAEARLFQLAIRDGRARMAKASM